MSGVDPALRALQHLQMRRPQDKRQVLAMLDDLAGLRRQLASMRHSIGLELSSLNRTILATRAYASSQVGRRQKGTHL